MLIDKLVGVLRAWDLYGFNAEPLNPIYPEPGSSEVRTERGSKFKDVFHAELKRKPRSAREFLGEEEDGNSIGHAWGGFKGFGLRVVYLPLNGLGLLASVVGLGFISQVC